MIENIQIARRRAAVFMKRDYSENEITMEAGYERGKRINLA